MNIILVASHWGRSGAPTPFGPYGRRDTPALSADRPGLLGAILGRAEAQVLRMALIYALLDGRNYRRRTPARSPGVLEVRRGERPDYLRRQSGRPTSRRDPARVAPAPGRHDAHRDTRALQRQSHRSEEIGQGTFHLGRGQLRLEHQGANRRVRPPSRALACEAMKGFIAYLHVFSRSLNSSKNQAISIFYCSVATYNV